MLKEIKVIKILGEPRETYMNIENVTVEYWSVPVIMSGDNITYESSVTFATYKEAKDLQVKEVFYR